MSKQKNLYFIAEFIYDIRIYISYQKNMCLIAGFISHSRIYISQLKILDLIAEDFRYHSGIQISQQYVYLIAELTKDSCNNTCINVYQQIRDYKNIIVVTMRPETIHFSKSCTLLNYISLYSHEFYSGARSCLK